MASKFLILGSGPSGLIMGNILKDKGEDFSIITTKNDGFGSKGTTEKLEYALGQRTLFYDSTFNGYLCDWEGVGEWAWGTDTLKASVFYKGAFHQYPFQNNLALLGWKDKAHLYWDYYMRNRKLGKAGNFHDWVKGNYGNFIAKEIILPHTWKTVKEDLMGIDASSYAQKVVPLGSKNKEIRCFHSPTDIMNALRNRIKEHIEEGKVRAVNLEQHTVSYDIDLKYGGTEVFHYGKLINSIALPKFMELVDSDDEELSDIIEVAWKSLKWNNMFVVSMVVPTSFLSVASDIIYFPDREYLFSKVNIERKNGYSVVVSEISFRRNDEELLKNEAYKKKITDRVEWDLKKAGVVKENMFTSYSLYTHVVSPAYIICDMEYGASNSVLQNYLEHNSVYNIGRFAQWLPHMRVEHSLTRANEIQEKI